MFKKTILVLVGIMLLAGCSGDQDSNKKAVQVQKEIIAQPLPKEALQPTSSAGPVTSARHQLLFFIDPNGRPCQMQAQILTELADELRDRVNVRYVQTTVAPDRDVFYQYGIRSLPSLVLADGSGKEIGRLTPGVKNGADILGLINTLPGS